MAGTCRHTGGILMGGTKYKSSDPRMFTVPSSDNLRDALTGNAVSCSHEIRMTVQRGVFEFLTHLWDERRGKGSPHIASLEETYPNSRAESWEAFWFAHTNKVARMADDYRRDQDRAGATRVKGG
jgi:hypothetical protein